MLNTLFSYTILDYFLIAILGAVIGSFLNVIIIRLPTLLILQWSLDERLNSQPAISPASSLFNLYISQSHCIHCKKILYWHHNIPLFSYIYLRGHCHFCQHAISKQYFLVELLTSILTIIVFQHFGYRDSMWLACLLTWCLIALSVIDLNTQLLPDALTLPLLWSGLVINSFSIFTSAQDSILAAAAGYIILWCPATLFQYYRKKMGMGHGDFKLLAALGAWLGLIPLINVLSIAIALGLSAHLILLIFKKMKVDEPIAFGPALAFSGWVVLLSGPIVTNRLLDFA